MVCPTLDDQATAILIFLKAVALVAMMKTRLVPGMTQNIALSWSQHIITAVLSRHFSTTVHGVDPGQIALMQNAKVMR